MKWIHPYHYTIHFDRHHSQDNGLIIMAAVIPWFTVNVIVTKKEPLYLIDPVEEA